jgi:hypothetical protein
MYEHADPEDNCIPDCDLVIINGNCGYVKRTMIYVESLCKKYPNMIFLVNLGMRELIHQKNEDEIREGLTFRRLFSEHWPKNLIFSFKKPIMLSIKGRNINILCLYGYPNVAEGVQDDANWRSTEWYRFTYHGITHDQKMFKPKEASDVYHGHFPIWSTPDLCRRDHDKELSIVYEWLENTNPDECKILLTAISPINEPALDNIPYEMFPEISPDYWIVGGTDINQKINRCTVYGNPGRGILRRNNILSI